MPDDPSVGEIAQGFQEDKPDSLYSDLDETDKRAWNRNDGAEEGKGRDGIIDVQEKIGRCLHQRGEGKDTENIGEPLREEGKGDHRTGEELEEGILNQHQSEEGTGEESNLAEEEVEGIEEEDGKAYGEEEIKDVVPVGVADA